MLWLLLMLASQEAEGLPTLKVDSPLFGEIGPGDSVLYVHGSDDHPGYRGKSFRLDIAEPGSYSVELDSPAFVPRLIVRGPNGEFLSNGTELGIGLNKHVALEVSVPGEYRVDVCARGDRRGPFELRLSQGFVLPSRSEERRAMDREAIRFRLEFIEGIHGADSAEYAQDLSAVGAMLLSSETAGEAYDYQTRAQEIFTRVLGPTNPDTLRCMDQVAATLAALGRVNESRTLAEELIELRIGVHGPDAPKVAMARVSLAESLLQLGEIPDSIEQFRLALEPLSGSPVYLEYLLSAYTGLGTASFRIGNLEAAETYLRLALDSGVELQGAVPGPKHSQLMALGHILVVRGKLGEARDVLARGLAAVEQALGTTHPSYAGGLLYRSAVKQGMGDLEGALEDCERALSIVEQAYGENTKALIPYLFTLTAVYLSVGQFDHARETAERQFEIARLHYGEQSFEWAVASASAAQARYRAGEREGGELAVSRALEVLDLYPSAYRPGIDTYLWGVLGEIAADAADHEESLRIFRRCLKETEQRLGRGHELTDGALRGVLEALIGLGRPEEAWLLLLSYWPDQLALYHLELSSMTEVERLRFLTRCWSRLGGFVELAVELGESHHLEEAYGATLAWKGWGTRLMLASRESMAAGDWPEGDELAGRLRETQAAMSAMTHDLRTGDEAGHAERLEGLIHERNRIELEIQNMIGPTGGDTVTPAELRARLPDRSVVLDFLVHERVHVWISRPDHPTTVHVDLGEASVLREAMRDHLSAIESRSDQDLGGRLRELLWDPIAEEVGDADLVMVSPDQFITALPFGTIRLQDGQFLLEGRAFAYVRDAASLPGIIRSEPSNEFGSLLACGGLDFDSRSFAAVDEPSLATGGASLRAAFAGRWGPLPGSLGEAQSVAVEFERRHDGDVLVLQGAAATEERIKHELPKYSVLHLATHGFFLPDRGQSDSLELHEQFRGVTGLHPGLLTGLVWAGANEPPKEGREDGYLTAEELQWLDLSGAELIVLSACETGIGQTRMGEGMIGLKRACRIAGARTVVSSLWRVSDDSTSRLMTAFYENLWTHGMGRLEALRTAQLELLEEHQPPAAWGAFVLSGDWR